MKSCPLQPDLFKPLLGFWMGLGGLAAVTVAALGWPGPWVLLCVVAPLCEELVFRWGLQEAMLRRGLAPGWSNVITALAFALLHGLSRSWALALGVLVPALALGWWYQSSRVSAGPSTALRRCVAGHAGFNACYLLWLAQMPPGWMG